MSLKKFLLVYEAFDNTNAFLLKGNAAVTIDTEKNMDDILKLFNDQSYSEARKIDNYARRVAVIGVIEI